MTLNLTALHGGAYTQIALGGTVATAPQSRDLRRLLALLALWRGGPVEVFLSVGIDTAGWLEVWDAALAAVPRRHASIRFLVDRSWTGVDGDEDCE